MKPSIPETGTVLRTDRDEAVVMLHHEGSCKGCGAAEIGLCGIAGAASLLTVKNRMGAVSGNVVKVGLDARTQREGFLLAFIIPLLSFVAGTVTGHFINTAFGVSSMEVAIGFISLVAAATLCFRRLKRLNSSSPIAIQAVVSECAFTGGSRPCS